MWRARLVRILGDFGRGTRRSSYVSTLDFRDIPTPKRLPVVGTALSLLAAGGASKLHEYVDKRHRQLGPIFRDNVGPVTAVFLSDPEVMRSVFAQEGKYPLHIKPEPWLVYNEKHNYTRGLFFMDGDKWMHFRRIMNKLLLKGDLAWIEDACEMAADLILRRLLFYSEKGAEFPTWKKELYKWSMDVIVSVLVGADTYRQSREDIEPIVEILASTVQAVFETTSKLTLLPATLAARYNIPQWRRFENSVTAALKSANEVVNHLEEKYPKGDGLLSRLQEEGLDKADTKRIVADLILGGGDTTTYTMEWMLYLIAKHSDVQERLRGGDKTLAKNVLRETLRLYPVAPFLTRFMPDSATIAGYSVPAGTLVVMSIYTSGRDERNFKEAARFFPDRWLRSGAHGCVGVGVQQASLPFAMGARSCIGKKIAEAQLQVTLLKVVKEFQVETLNKREVGVVMKMVAKPAEPLRLKFTRI
ncbi:hypothetical protein NQ318_020128 [Aromia moschata]|uniref:Cytochrome P450 n=1 Tax=Aromia moschata TaxID=1265417 RepID=A0AAV8Z962_9CUCU|nr:hypothetical protein NQ318_020128 [Aromia moschata]